MSLVKNTGFKKMECGDLHHSEQMIRDTGGGYVDFQIVGTDVTVGVITGIPTLNSGDYRPTELNPDGTFMICIEAVGVFYVTLFDGSDFIITLVQSTAYLGQWYPAKIWSVNQGTTGDFSVGY
jgi:hypothetical protein